MNFLAARASGCMRRIHLSSPAGFPASPSSCTLAGSSSSALARQHPRVAARCLSTWQKDREASLVLEDGTTITGSSFGYDGSIAGEIVFNTGMTGYNETFTDPSYQGQILVMTYPLIGNYGVPPDTLDELGLPKYFESAGPKISGLVVCNYSQQYSHWEATRSLSEWLKDNQVPAIQDVDTRALTRLIREKGALKAKMVADDMGHTANSLDFVDINSQNLVEQVSVSEVKTYGNGDVHILAVDCGMKHSILRSLVGQGATVTVVPWDFDIVSEFKKDKYQGLFVSNGPGDPSMANITTKNIETIVASSNEKPIFGICLGHQLLSRAAGADTFKLPYGHRSQNQPCIDVFSQRCYITSQNHGFAVDHNTLPAQWLPYFVNANDQTSEGIIHQSKPYFSVQFHPEAKCGPEDTRFLFDTFLDMCRGKLDHAVPGDARAALAGTLGSAPQSAQTKTSAKKEKLSVGQVLTSGRNMFDIVSVKADTVTPPEALPSTADLPASSAMSIDTSTGVSGQPLVNPSNTSSPLFKRRKKVLILGSGGLQIGQAGEFDYSGSQAIKALQEEGIKTVLINPNIATVQTADGLADTVYFLPVTLDFVTRLIEKERPDGLLLQFGGQTALNVGIELHDSGILAKYGVDVMGTSVATIVATEDRDIFAKKLTEINERIATSVAATTVKDALKAANDIGYPVIVRAAFSLGGLGSGFAHNDGELRDLVTRALTSSPQVLVERSMKGWKEVEYEVVRDAYDNAVTVCNMENFDPLGIHTGDSIVIAPSQTLNDHEYHMLRTASINTVRHLGIVGECNVQFALNPHSREYCIIECNPRLSRSSALASKATGYPLAFVACKLAMGISLPSVINNVTKTTTACFEPSLDYVVTKVPRWDLEKFSNVSRLLGSGMKSVGEVMAIGRTFEESFQKALRMVDKGASGFLGSPMEFKQLDSELQKPTDRRVWAIAKAFEQGYSVDRLHELTKVDRWFLQKCNNIMEVNKMLALPDIKSFDALPRALLRKAKLYGFSDSHIAKVLSAKFDCTEDDVRAQRKSQGIVPSVKQVDTLAAEFPAQTNYLYMSYAGSSHDIEFPEQKNDKDVIVLGGGTYRIGSSVEFDYSAMSAIRKLRSLGRTTTVINYNPETVSTDYDESERLFFEELSLERVLDVYDLTKPLGVMVSVGGQIPNNLALPLGQRNIPILGTSAKSIDNAEDRRKFSSMLDSIGVSQPEWQELSSFEEARSFAEAVTYPVLVRPSYVLSGGGMQIVKDEAELRHYLQTNSVVSADFPVVVSKFIEDALEIDFDGVAHDGKVIAHAISQHVENAGVHSGDATLVLPAQNVDKELSAKLLEVGAKMANALSITGPFNSQLIVTGSPGNYDIKVIECNVRASRSLPFVSKTLGEDLAGLATQAMLSNMDSSVPRPLPIDIDVTKLPYVCVKAPQFSFTRLLGADPMLGVEMSSTGEVACFGRTVEEAFLKSLLSTHIKLPKKTVLLSTGSEKFKNAMLPSVRKLVELGYELFATPGTAVHLEENGIECSYAYFDLGGQGQHPKASALLQNGDINMVINVPSFDKTDLKDELSNCFLVRRAAVDYSVPLITNLKVAEMMVSALANVDQFTTPSYDDVKALKKAAL